MRTTIVFDSDVYASLKRLMKSRETSFRELVNELLRSALSAPRPKGQGLELKTFSSPFAPGVDPGRLNELADELEIDEFANP